MDFETAKSRWATLIQRQHRRGDLPPEHLWVALLNPETRKPFLPPTGSADGPIVQVRMNAGRWLAECPFCTSAQHASEDGWFYCANCQNETAGRMLLPQEWPGDEERGQLEDQLAQRPAKRFRNWEPGETIDDLKRQDEEALSG